MSYVGIMDSQQSKKRTRGKRTLSEQTINLLTDRITALMERRGMNVLDLSKASKIDNATLYKIINKKDKQRAWTLDQLELIAPALQVEIWELFQDPMAPVTRTLELPEEPEKPEGWENTLLSKFPDFDPAWSDEVKAKWFEGFKAMKEMMASQQSK
jgi:transcriptional regulator with XRE-family HTH domain